MNVAMQLPLRIVAMDVDGTLTDGTTWFAGPELGWVQRYNVRDGEAILRMKCAGVQVVPLSRNKTMAARRRMEALGLELRWLGIDDKMTGLDEILASFSVQLDEVCFVGDGREDAPVIARVGLGLAVSNAHPEALRAADCILEVPGGAGVMEAVELALEARKRLPSI